MKKSNALTVVLTSVIFIAFIIFAFLFLTSCNKPDYEAINKETVLVKISTIQQTQTVNIESTYGIPEDTETITDEITSETAETSEITETLTAPVKTKSKTIAPEPTQTKKPEPTSAPKISNVVSNSKMTITIPQLAVRKYNSTEYSVVGYIYYGESFSTQGKTANGWYKINYKNIIGYVDGRYLKTYPLKTEPLVTDTPMMKDVTSAPAATSPAKTTVPATETPAIIPEETQTATATYFQPNAINEVIGIMPNSSGLLNYSTLSSSIKQKYIQTNYVNPYVAYTYTQMMKDIDKLTDYYDFLQTGEIGKSNLGRSIPYIKLGKGTKKLFICASMHAREYMATSYIMKIIETYSYCYANDITYGTFRVKRFLDTYSLWIVPMVNPDGVAIATEPQNVDINDLAKIVGSEWVTPDVLIKWKANGRGVDLNNNFNCAWASMNMKTKSPAYMSYKGPSAESEPETKAVINFCGKNNFDAAISLHSKGEIIYWDDAISTGKIPKAEIFTDAVCNLTGYVKIPVTTSVNGYGGGFENWFRKEFKKPGICVELTPGTGGEIPHNPKDFNSLIWEKSKYMPLIAIQSLL